MLVMCLNLKKKKRLYEVRIHIHMIERKKKF